MGEKVIPGCRSGSWTQEEWSEFLGNIGLLNPSVFREKPRRIFDIPEERQKLASGFVSLFSELEPGDALYFVYKEEDPLSPFTRIFRTQGYVFCRNDSQNIILGEARTNVIFENQFQWNDWANPRFFPISPEARKRFQFLGGKSASGDNVYFGYKRMNSKESKFYPQWMVRTKSPEIYRAELISEREILYNSEGNFQRPFGDPLDPVVGQSEDSKSKSIESRLLELESLREKKLITESEYKTKRKEILDDL